MENQKDDEERSAKKRRVEASSKTPMMKDFVLRSFSKIKNDPKLWEDLPDELKQDEEIAVAAWLSRCLKKAPDFLDFAYLRGLMENRQILWCKLPEDMQNNQAFARSCLQHGQISWYCLSEDLTNDRDFARSCLQFLNSSLCVTRIFDQIPSLADDRDVWLRLIPLEVQYDVLFFKPQKVPAHIKADAEIMLALYRHDRSSLRYAASTLTQDRGFVSAVLQTDPWGLQHLNHGTQNRFPDLLIEALGRFPGGLAHHQCDSLSKSISRDLWENRDVVEAWFNAGFPFTKDLPDSLKHDERVFFLLAANWRIRGHPSESFRYADSSICGKKEFMMSVVEQHFWFFHFASMPLQKDFDLAVLAFSFSCRWVKAYIRKKRYDGQRDFIQKLESKMNEKLQLHEVFFQSVLCIMSANSQCKLAMLNQGEATALAYKKLITEYAGVPIGRELGLIRRASTNLSNSLEWHKAHPSEEFDSYFGALS